MTIIPAVSLLVFLAAPPLQPPGPREITIAAPDGVKLKATYYDAGRPGPAVLLLHMCNTTRTSWAPLAPQLAAAGIHALAVDYRGFGESEGPRADTLPPADAQAAITQKWPGDIDAAFAFLTSRPGVDGTRVGAAGGSCGVGHAVRLARRQPNVKSLVLLAGQLDPDGIRFLQQSAWLPVFGAAAADDQFDTDAPETMQWIVEMSGNPRNRFSGFKDGRHGTEIFGPHPELPKEIVDWYVETLVKGPADPKAATTVKQTPMREFWQRAATRDGVPAAVAMFHSRKDKDAPLFPESQLNLLGYQYLQAGDVKEAIELFKLNVDANPQSANTYDSLGDAYLAGGQNELALQMAEKALALLPADRSDAARKQLIRDSAEQKIAQLKKK